MDIKNAISSILPTASVSARSASAAQNVQSVLRQQPSSQARQFIENVSTSTKLAAVEKQGLIQAASIADQFLSGASQTQAFSEVANMGLYFQNTSTKEFPRWNLLTGLRYYGLNRDPEAKGITEQQAIQQVRQQLEQVANNRNVQYSDVQARHVAKSEPVKMQETAKMFGHAVSQVSESREVKGPEAKQVDIKA